MDIWAVGCIIGEILQLTSFETSHSFRRKTTVLFPGETLQAMPTSMEDFEFADGYCFDKSDQLYSIIERLGSPTYSDLNFISDKITKEYIKKFPRKVNNLRSLFPHIENDDAFDFLEGLLTFNPKKRMSAEKALNHPFLEDVLNKENNILCEPEEGSDKVLYFEEDLTEKLTERKLRKYFNEVFENSKYIVQE